MEKHQQSGMPQLLFSSLPIGVSLKSSREKEKSHARHGLPRSAELSGMLYLYHQATVFINRKTIAMSFAGMTSAHRTVDRIYLDSIG